MTLYVGAGGGIRAGSQMVTAFTYTCRDPAIRIDWSQKDRALKTDGKVIYDNITDFSEPCVRLWKIVHADVPVVLRAVLPGTTVYSVPVVPGVWEDVKARDQPGFTRPNYDDTGTILLSIDVVIEPGDDLGRQYWVEDVNGDKIWSSPPSIIAHEFGHVEEILEGRFDPNIPMEDQEGPGIAAENAWRNLNKHRERHGHEGGNDLQKERGGATGGDCFIATAAYGSELEDEVQELRSFRDDVLLQTRAGAEFFEHYFPKYYNLSPAIVTLMHTDPEMKDLVRWSLVAPIVQFLRLAKNFPREDTADVPEPWRTYLESARGAFEEWTANLPRPRDFADVPPADAAEELRVTLEHFTWRDDDAAGYVDALRAAGALPLAANPETLTAIATMLRGRGARDETVAAVTGIGPAASGVGPAATGVGPAAPFKPAAPVAPGGTS